MSEQTMQSYMAELKAFFAWAIKELNCFEHNPAVAYQGDGRDRTTKDSEKRDVFSATEIQQIFSADYYKTGSPPLTKRGKPRHQFRPFYYWIPLLSLYTGARPNELAQLYLDDIHTTKEGTSYIDTSMVGDATRRDQIEADEGDPDETKGSQSLKTVNARRIIPLHRHLIELGLLTYVDTLRSVGQTRLFPELRFDATKGYGLEARKWFNERRLGNELGIERTGRKTLYSFRHGFATTLSRLESPEIPTLAFAQLMGHSRGTELSTKRYAKDRKAEDVSPYIERLTFALPEIAPFSSADGIRAMEYAVKLKDSYGRKKIRHDASDD